jgi:hypothetical protein
LPGKIIPWMLLSGRLSLPLIRFYPVYPFDNDNSQAIKKAYAVAGNPPIDWQGRHCLSRQIRFLL